MESETGMGRRRECFFQIKAEILHKNTIRRQRKKQDIGRRIKQKVEKQENSS